MKRILFCIAIIYGSAYGAMLDYGPLHRAAISGNVAEVQRLLDEGVDVDSRGYRERTPLYVAAQAGRADIVAMLLSRGANAHAEEYWEPDEYPYDQDCPRMTALSVASRRWEVLEMFLALNVDLRRTDGSGDSVLHHASCLDDHVVAENLLTYGIVDPNAQNHCGESALHYATRNRNKKIMELLIAKGANINLSSRSGATALHCAASSGDREAITLLIAAGANPNAQDNQGLTALHKAADSSLASSKTIQALLEAGAQQDIKNNRGETALFLAATMGHVCRVEALLRGGAKSDIKNFCGQTPLTVAKERSSLRVIEAMEWYNRKSVLTRLDLIVRDAYLAFNQGTQAPLRNLLSHKDKETVERIQNALHPVELAHVRAIMRETDRGLGFVGDIDDDMS